MKRTKAKKPQRSFPFLRVNEREAKPRKRGLTEIRGPYYSVVGRRYLEDLFETMGAYVDSLKFAGGSFALMPERAVRDIIELCHKYDVLVSTGGFIERVLVQGGEAAPAELKAEGTRDPNWAIAQAKRFLEAGADIIMIESEGITENVDPWRTDVPAKFIDAIGMEKLMFEAADPDVFAWYIKNYGADVNLFVDHSQIVQLECLRSGIWGTKSLWGKVVSYKDGDE